MTAAGPGQPLADSWVAAIHATEHDFMPLGAAVVIDEQRILTCAHVVLTNGSVRDPLWVAFPKAVWTGKRCQVVLVTLPENPQLADLALLTLGAAVPADVLAAPLRCPEPAGLVNRKWWAFGFASGDPLGNTADGVIGAALAYGWVRLDAESRYHVEPGFSGGGLWSPDYEAVVGVVGKANARGDGCAITLHQADLCFPAEKLRALAGWSPAQADEIALAAWGWTLQHDPEAFGHWHPRARGVRAGSEHGYRFGGRSAALRAIKDWLDRPRPDLRALVVTGSPGVGKSAVLGRVVTTADPAAVAALPTDDDAVRATERSVSCAVHARGKTALEVAAEIARAASAALPERVKDIVPALRAVLASRAGRPVSRFNLIVDALDEAASPAHARAIITGIVLPLVEMRSGAAAQVVVGTRRRDDDGDLLGVFGDALTIIDLDAPEFFEEADLEAYALATVQLTGDERPGSPYADLAVARPVARRIAALSERNFLIAGLVALRHGLHDHDAVDPARLEFTASVGGALRDYLRRLGPVTGIPAATVLTALAFAEAPGLPVGLWRVALGAISGQEITAQLLARFARSSAANFLVETGPEGHTGPAGTGSVFRLFHQALNDALLAARSEMVPCADDERAITRAFITAGQESTWGSAPSYLLRSLPLHAARGALIDELLADDEYLLHADLRRLIPLADQAATPAGQSRARLLRLTPQAIMANPPSRTALLSVTETLECLGRRFSSSTRTAPYRATWASVKPRTERAVLEGHTSPVSAVCAFTLKTRVLLASASGDHTVRVWDAGTGEHLSTLTGHAGWVTGLCAFTHQGQTLLASTSGDTTIRIWDAGTGEHLRTLTGHAGWVTGLCAFTHQGQTLLASTSSDTTIRIWDPGTGEHLRTLTGHAGRVTGLCAFTHQGQTLLASASEDSTIRIWDPATGQHVRTLEGHEDWTRGVCAFTLHGQTLLASASDDSTIRIWDPATGQQQHALGGHTGPFRSVRSLILRDQLLLASTERGSTIRIWDPVTGRQSRTLDGHTDGVLAVSGFILGDTTLLASASEDMTVRIWDPAASEHPDSRGALEGHNTTVKGLCTFTIGDRMLLATAGFDATIRIWDLATGQHQHALEGRTVGVTGICTLILEGRVLLAGTSHLGTIGIWDPVTGQRWRTMKGHTGPARGVCAYTSGDQVLLASTSDDATIRIWNPATGEHLRTLQGHAQEINGICALAVEGKTLLASASDDGTVRTWDPATGRQLHTLEGHEDWVQAVCAFTHGGQVLLASASNDHTVRVWDPSTGEHQYTLNGHTGGVSDVCSLTVAGRSLLASASSDHTVRTWDPASAACQALIPVHHQATAIAGANDILLVGLSVGLLAIQLDTAAPAA